MVPPSAAPISTTRSTSSTVARSPCEFVFLALAVHDHDGRSGGNGGFGNEPGVVDLHLDEYLAVDLTLALNAADRRQHATSLVTCLEGRPLHPLPTQECGPRLLVRICVPLGILRFREDWEIVHSKTGTPESEHAYAALY